MYVQVRPEVVYPSCLKGGRQQDCFRCKLRNRCKSPRGLCVSPYPNHPRGCPNYDKKPGCPPSVAMFDAVFNTNRAIYAIYNVFDLENHIRRMKARHPAWTSRQLRNCLYWQGTARKALRETVCLFITRHPGFSVTYCPEAMGVNVTETMASAGVVLEWPPTRNAYQVALAGIAKDGKTWK